eukprot:11265230-Alexandrium_andersonii.AAC.1
MGLLFKPNWGSEMDKAVAKRLLQLRPDFRPSFVSLLDQGALSLPSVPIRLGVKPPWQRGPDGPSPRQHHVSGCFAYAFHRVACQGLNWVSAKPEPNAQKAWPKLQCTSCQRRLRQSRAKCA